LRAVYEAAEALAAWDPELAAERAETAEAQAHEARGTFGRPMPEIEHQAVLAGLRAARLQRPPASSDRVSLPPKGTWCSRCGRSTRADGRWWCEAEAETGWRCSTCHPVPPGWDAVVVET
jgi:hypothetical protein